MKRWLKKWWPDSLSGQLLLTMLLGAALLQGVNLYAVCYIQHAYTLELHKVKYDYDSSIYLALSGMAPDQRELFIKGLLRSQSVLNQPSQLSLALSEPAWAAEQSHYADEAGRAMRASIQAGSASPVPALKTRVLNQPNPGVTGSEEASRLNPLLQTAVEMGDGTWLEITQPLYITNRRAVWLQRLFVLLESVLFSMVVIWLIRRATRPLKRLGQAAEQFGRHPEAVEPLEEAGSKEVREAAQSFNRMRERICDNLCERNRMLEAMGHDLRTPLTRIQLRLDKIEPEALREKFAHNLCEIESIIEQGLELASSLCTSEEKVQLDLTAFAQSLVDDLADQGLDVSLVGQPENSEEEQPPVLARPVCLRRCLENLLTNAVKYAGSARMSIFRQNGKLVLEVNDNGPGIPEELLEKVLEPYYRLERSRNRDFGGTGLGLSIARNMALLNNGTLLLKNRRGGGLSARVLLRPTQ